MATVHVFVATRRFASEREMDEFIDPTFTQDGDIVPSRFMREVELGGYEPGCIEAVHDADEKLVNSLVAPGHPSTPGYSDPQYPFFGRIVD